MVLGVVGPVVLVMGRVVAGHVDRNIGVHPDP